MVVWTWGSMEPSVSIRRCPDVRSALEEWGARVVAEYRSAALTAQTLHWLIAAGFSPDLIEDCRQIVADEMHHATLSREIMLALGGDESAIELRPTALEFAARRGVDRFLHIGFVLCEVFCCGETVARPLFRAMLANATQPLAQAALRRIVKDEARHSAFGWAALEEWLTLAPPACRAALEAEFPRSIERLMARYDPTGPTAAERLAPGERGWGLLDPADYRRITRACVDETIVPRFEALFPAAGGADD